MNKTQKKRTFIRSPLVAIPAVLLLRAAMLVTGSAIAFASEDPAALVDTAAYTAKLVCELISGVIIAKAVGNGFNPLTKITLAAISSLIINTAELLIGKSVCGTSPSGVIILPIAAAVCAMGAMLASKQKIRKRKKRSRR